MRINHHYILAILLGILTLAGSAATDSKVNPTKIPSLSAAPVTEAAAARWVVVLDGIWQLAEGTASQIPTQFDRQVPVPGLVDMAVPSFDPERFGANKNAASPTGDGAKTDPAFWYRREFKIEGEVPVVASLLVRKAAYGSTVYVNGQMAGASNASFTAKRYDVRAQLRGHGATNELVIRVGASRESLPRTVPRGGDYEKKRYIPGLFDSVELELSGTPHFVAVQAAPDIANQRVRVQARVLNSGPDWVGGLKFVVRQAKSGKVVGQAETANEPLASGAEKIVDVCIPIADCRLWSPEDPFLYTLQVSTGADTFETRFGMREFRFEPRQGDRPGRALLNGKPYFMRGSNVTLYRFFEDSQRGDLPWNEDWVRRLHQRFKEIHWNALRYCIGFPPEAWYRIADEEGFLIQDEFPIWGDETGELDVATLAEQYADWMRERWNHPCMVIWDAQNETVTEKTGAALTQVRGLDLSNRPWDNGWSKTQLATDVSEAHPYHFGHPFVTLSMALSCPVGMPLIGPLNPGNRHAYVINEYGWLWLNRDGTPTTLTKDLYATLAGKDATSSQLFPLAARLLAADTEYWRCRRQAAAVLHFCALGYSRPDGQTSDQWLDVKQLIWEPEFYRYVHDAFAPVGLMVDFAKEKILVNEEPERISVVVINDLETPWSGPVTLRLKRDQQVYAELKQECRLEPWGKTVLTFDVKWPQQVGHYRLEADLIGVESKPVRSLRDTEIVDGHTFGLAFRKDVTASSELSAYYGAAKAVDGDPVTLWSSTYTDPSWLAVDLGAVRTIRKIRIFWDWSFSKSYTVQVSTDGQTWTDVFQTGDGKAGFRDIDLTPTAMRHVRIWCTDRYPPQVCMWTQETEPQRGHAIRELQVFE